MTPPPADPYQRALDLLDDDRFWDRYVTQLQDDEARGRDRVDEQRPSADLTVVPRQPDGVQNDVTVLSTADGGGKRNRRRLRSKTFQRAAVAAAAGIGIVTGISLLNTDGDREPIDVTTETSTTETAEVPVAVVPDSREPEQVVLPPTPPDQTPTAEPLTTPNPESTPQPAEESAPALPAGTESDDESSDGPDTGAPGESATPADTAIDTAPAHPVDASSPLGQVLTEINALRRSQDLPALRFSPALSAVAHEQAWSLTDYQDTNLSRQDDFRLDPLSAERADAMRQLAWAEASVLGGIDIAGRLPAGWSDWQHFAGRGPVLEAVRADAARQLHVGDFTHVGVASAAGKFVDATVVVYANYPAEGPTEPSVVVRTDGRCSEQVADLNLRGKVIINPVVTIPSQSWPETMSHVELRLCAGVVGESLPQFDIDSRYRVSVLRRSDGDVMGNFTCFAWNTCEAVVDLQGSSAPFDIVLRKLSSDAFEISLGQVQTTFRSTDGQAYKLVAGNGSRLIDSDAMRAFWDRIIQSGGGWILESNG